MTLSSIKVGTALKSVLFDLDGTLYDYQLCHRNAFDCASRIAKRELALDKNKFTELYEKSRNIVHDRLNGTAASHSRLLYFAELVFGYTKFPDLAMVACLEKAYWSNFYGPMRLYDGALRLLKRLRQRSVKLALVTDMTTAIQFEKIRRLNLETIFDVVVTSEEAGCEKPNPRIFEICLRRLGVSAASVVHVGDDFGRDIVGARMAGISPILFAPGNGIHRLGKTKIAHSFSELSGLLVPCCKG